MHLEELITEQGGGAEPSRVAEERIHSLERLAAHKHEQLTRKDSELQAVVSASPAAIILTDLQGRIRLWNPAAERMLGYTEDEARTETPNVFCDTFQRRELEARLDRGHTFTGVELRLQAKDGKRVFVSASGAPVFHGAGHLDGRMWVLLDISDRKRAEETLRKSEKLASAGRMVAVMAHEINNPLEAIANLMYLLSNENLTERARSFVTLAESELKRVVQMARQTLGFYRDTNKPQLVRLADVFDQVAQLYSHRMTKRGVMLERDYRSAGEVLAFPGELRQLFTNLISNAMEAEATTLRVRIGPHVEHRTIERKGSLLTFSDNGKGIPAEVKRHIFEPFFTTKGEKGTGLGLWVSRGIVHKYEGFLRVRSLTEGARRGTSFSIFFPAPAERGKVVPIDAGKGGPSAADAKAA